MFSRNLLTAVSIAALLLRALDCHSDVVILTADSPYAVDIAKKVQSGIAAPSRIQSSLEETRASDIIVALGGSALREAQTKKAEAVVGAFINYSDMGSSDSDPNVKRVIYFDPSPKRIANFLDKNFSRAKIGFIYTDDDRAFAEAIKLALEKNNNELIAVSHNGNTFGGLNDLTRKDIDIMFIGRNRAIYKPDNIHFVLESLFRKKIPVITTSKTLINAGATVSISATDNAVILETSTAVNEMLKKPQKDQSASFADNIEVNTNKSMTEFFNLRFKQEDE